MGLSTPIPRSAPHLLFVTNTAGIGGGLLITRSMVHSSSRQAIGAHQIDAGCLQGGTWRPQFALIVATVAGDEFRTATSIR